MLDRRVETFSLDFGTDAYDLIELQRTLVSNMGNGLEPGVCETIEKLISMSQRKLIRT